MTHSGATRLFLTTFLRRFFSGSGCFAGSATGSGASGSSRSMTRLGSVFADADAGCAGWGSGASFRRPGLDWLVPRLCGVPSWSESELSMEMFRDGSKEAPSSGTGASGVGFFGG